MSRSGEGEPPPIRTGGAGKAARRFRSRTGSWPAPFLVQRGTESTRMSTPRALRQGAADDTPECPAGRGGSLSYPTDSAIKVARLEVSLSQTHYNGPL